MRSRTAPSETARRFFPRGGAHGSNSVAAVPLFSRLRPVSSFGLSRVALDQPSEAELRDNDLALFVREAGNSE